jgi:hypothetical protein
MSEAAATHPRPKVIAARILAALAGVYAILAGLDGLFDIDMAGFPDGAITDYEKAVKVPFTILSFVGIGAGIYFFFLAIFIRRKHLLATIIVSFVLYCLIVPGTWSGIEYYLKNFTDINYGQGG